MIDHGREDELAFPFDPKRYRKFHGSRSCQISNEGHEHNLSKREFWGGAPSNIGVQCLHGIRASHSFGDGDEDCRTQPVPTRMPVRSSDYFPRRTRRSNMRRGGARIRCPVRVASEVKLPTPMLKPIDGLFFPSTDRRCPRVARRCFCGIGVVVMGRLSIGRRGHQPTLSLIVQRRRMSGHPRT